MPAQERETPDLTKILNGTSFGLVVKSGNGHGPQTLHVEKASTEHAYEGAVWGVVPNPDLALLSKVVPKDYVIARDAETSFVLFLNAILPLILYTNGNGSGH